MTFSKHYYIVEQFHEKKLSLKHRTEQNISSLIVVVNSKSFQKQAHKTENILLIFFSYQTQLYGQKHFSPVYWTISREKKLNSIIHYNCLRIIVVVFSSCYTLESKSNSLQTSAQTKITYSSISNPKLTRINSSSIYPISVMSLLSNFKVQTKTLTSHYSPRGVDDIKDLRLDSQLLSEASCVVRSPTNWKKNAESCLLVSVWEERPNFLVRCSVCFQKILAHNIQCSFLFIFFWFNTSLAKSSY